MIANGDIHSTQSEKMFVMQRTDAESLECKFRGSQRFPWAKYSRMDQAKCFKGCRPQILLGPFSNTLSHLLLLNKSSQKIHTANTDTRKRRRLFQMEMLPRLSLV